MQSAIERFDELKLKLYEFEGYAIRPCWFMYNQFIELLKLELHPSQFIHWDKENDCPLEEPIVGLVGNEQYEGAEMDKYQKAESEILFKDFEIIEYNGTKSIAKFLLMKDLDNKPMYYHIAWLKNNQWTMSHGLKTVENIHRHVDLNENGLKLGGYDTAGNN